MQLPLGIDPGRAALSFGLAFILYFFALNETNPETTTRTTFTIPVEVVNVPTGMVVVERPQPVQVRVRAPLDALSRLRPQSFTAQADATGAKAGSVDLAISIFAAPEAGVRDVFAEPARETVRIEEVQERALPVRVNATGQLPAGYQLGQAKPDPARVSVSGPSSVVRLAVEAVVDVSVDRLTVTVNGAFTPRIVDQRGNEIKDLTLRPTAVNVEMPITQQAQFKEVGVRPRIQGRPAAGYFLEPLEVEPPTVTLFGEPQALEGANFVETEPIDVNGISSTVVRRANLVSPANTLLLQPGQTVDVTIRVSPLTVTQTLRVPVSVLNLPSQLVVVRQPDPVEVTLTGPAPTLTSLTARDLRITVDLADKTAGKLELAPKVENLPAGMQMDNIQPKTIALELAPAPQPTSTP